MTIDQQQKLREHLDKGVNCSPVIHALRDLDLEKRILWAMTALEDDGVDSEARDHQMYKIDEAFEALTAAVLESAK